MNTTFKRIAFSVLAALCSQIAWSAGVVVEERKIGSPSSQKSTNPPQYLQGQKPSSAGMVEVQESDSVDLNLMPARPIEEVESGFVDEVVENTRSVPINNSPPPAGNFAWNNYELLEDLRREVSTLRSMLEEANNRIESLEKRQKDIYLDLDSRLTEVGTNRPATQSPPPVDTGGATLKTNKVESGLSATDQAAYKKDYLKATTALQSGRVVDAKKGFETLLAQHPTGTYASSCHYWLGQIASSDTPARSQDAINHYRAVIEQFPGSAKESASLFKLGKTYYEMKKFDTAKPYFERLVKEFPQDNASSLAARYLKELK